jgi:hypothetical protein
VKKPSGRVESQAVRDRSVTAAAVTSQADIAQADIVAIRADVRRAMAWAGQSFMFVFC